MNTNTISYGSVCSGIEAASVAWEVLGFSPAWFSQFDPEHKYKNGPDFPSAVLAHHWPEVPNLGDMTKLAAKMRAGKMDAPDILVGGTPCQAFSVAGARAGLSDPRGQLTISYGELADAIDDRRAAAGLPPAIIVWENVPGVLSSKDNAFGAFLGLLSGEDCELQPPGKRWANAGCVLRGKRAIAWRILDAQYFGVAQRRRRVFVVASARTDIDPAQILFERDGVRRDTAPSRSAGKTASGTTGNGVKVGSHWDNPANPHPTLNQSHNIGGIGQSNQELFSQRGSGITIATSETVGCMSSSGDTKNKHGFGWGQQDWQSGYCQPVITQSVNGDIAHTLKAEGFDGSEDGTGRGTPIIAMAHGQGGAEIKTDDSAPTLTCNHEAPIAAYGIYAFAENTQGEVRLQDGDGQITGPLSTGGGKPGQGYPAIAYSLQHAQIGRKDTAGPQGKGWQEEVGFTLDSRADADAVAVARTVSLRGREGGATAELGDEVATCLRASTGGGDKPHVLHQMAVRRLTPVECERLQGFPDNHTLIPTEKRKQITAEEYAYLRHHFPNMTAEEAYRLAADGPRYKAIGNSMAVPVMRWIGARIMKAMYEADSRKAAKEAK